MALAFGRWRPRHLLVGWGIYWAVLALVSLGSGLQAVWRMTRPDRHGSVSASFDDGLLRVSVIGDGVTAWAGATDLGTLALWVAGPPLLLWLAWLVSRPRRDDALASAPPGAHPSASRRAGQGGAVVDGAGPGARALNPPSPEAFALGRQDRLAERERRGRAT
jgi:hypothetical protein